MTAAGADCEGVDAYVGATAAQRKANRQLGQWIAEQIRETARARSIPLIDVAAETPCSSETLRDPIHPTEHGHDTISLTWAKHLARILSGKTPSKRQPQKSQD